MPLKAAMRYSPRVITFASMPSCLVQMTRSQQPLRSSRRLSGICLPVGWVGPGVAGSAVLGDGDGLGSLAHAAGVEDSAEVVDLVGGEAGHGVVEREDPGCPSVRVQATFRLAGEQLAVARRFLDKPRRERQRASSALNGG
jgi:hypothetical protein